MSCGVSWLVCEQLLLAVQVGLMRQQLSAIYEREQNWREAANILVGIPLETAQKYVASAAISTISTKDK